MTVVNLYPDNPKRPRSWRSTDAADPEVVLTERSDGAWTARLERRTVARGDSAEKLAALLYGEYELLAVLNGATPEVA